MDLRLFEVVHDEVLALFEKSTVMLPHLDSHAFFFRWLGQSGGVDARVCGIVLPCYRRPYISIVTFRSEMSTKPQLKSR